MTERRERDRRLPVLLATVGLALSIILELIHVRAYLDPTVASFCNVDARFDCDAVALSRASVILGVPTAVWGIAGYVALLIAALRRSPLLLPLAAIAALATTALLVVGIRSVGALCLVCEAVHLTSLTLLVVAWRRRDLKSLRAKDTIDLVWPLMIVVLVHLLAPPYWVLASWKSGPRLDHGLTDDGLHWIGAESPELVVHEYVDYTCPHCALASSRMRMLVARHSSSLQLVRHPYPRMRCMPPRPSRCLTARAAICAGQQDHFWEMEDWLFANAPGHVKIEFEPAVAELELDAAAFEACMGDQAVYQQLDDDIQAARRLKIREVPSYVIDGETVSVGDIWDSIEERL